MGVCNAPLELAALLAYWLDELPAEEAARIEEHYVGCAHCARRLEGLVALVSGVREVVRAGRVSTVISMPLLEAFKRAGLRLREYPVAPGGSVDCTIRADDDGVLSRFEAPLGDAERIDLIELESGARLEDIPFDPAAGEVLVLPSAEALRRLPAHVATYRLVAVDAGGDRLLGEYRFVHTPS